MNRFRPLALWLAAAILAILVSLAPGLSEAHEGHGSAGDWPDVSVSMTGDGAAAGLQAALAGAALDIAEAPISGELRNSVGGCAEPCWAGGGHAGSCCCAIGLAPAPEPAILPHAHAARPLPGDTRRRPDIPRKALPEPPRPLA